MNPSPHQKMSSKRKFTRWPVVVLGVALFGGTAVALGVRDTLRIPIARDHGAGNPPDAALFSHWDHGRFACQSCHPSTFPQARIGFTHADMEQGRYCGSCHDGRSAFGPKDKGIECELCHVPSVEREIDGDDLWN